MIAQNLPVYTSEKDPNYVAQMAINAIPKYHWKASPPNLQFPIYNQVAPSITPTIVDLRPYASPIDDQGNLGSCTGNAIAGAIDLVDYENKKSERVSRLFIYYQERVIEGDITKDNGAYIHDGITACSQTGAPLESLWPYTVSKFAVQPNQTAYTDAAKRKVTGYSKCNNFAAVKTALANKAPVVIGFYVYSSFESGTWWQPRGTGLMPYPNTRTEQLLGGHAVCIVGYNDNLTGPAGKGYFIVRNSWGTSWGQQGYFYMPYSVIQNTSMSSDFWAITSVANP